MKKTSELTNEEWSKVWSENNRLRMYAFDRACDTAYNRINDDYLPYFKGVKMDYSFGAFLPCYLAVNDGVGNMLEFVRATREASKFVGLLCETQHKSLMDDAEAALKHLDDVGYGADEYDKLYDAAMEKFNALVSEVEEVMASEYSWCKNDDSLERAFFEFMQAEFERDDSYFVDENYILYKRTVKCYK